MFIAFNNSLVRSPVPSSHKPGRHIYMYMYVKILVIFRFDFWILYVCIALMYVYSHIWCVFSKAYVQYFVNQKKFVTNERKMQNSNRNCTCHKMLFSVFFLSAPLDTHFYKQCIQSRLILCNKKQICAG